MREGAARSSASQTTLRVLLLVIAASAQATRGVHMLVTIAIIATVRIVVVIVHMMHLMVLQLVINIGRAGPTIGLHKDTHRRSNSPTFLQRCTSTRW
jgi:hypothetical protein